MDSYTWTHQCWLTSKNLHSSALCRHGWQERQSKELELLQNMMMMMISNALFCGFIIESLSDLFERDPAGHINEFVLF